MEKSKKVLIAVGTAALIGVAAVGGSLLLGNSSTQTATQGTTSSSTNTAGTTNTATNQSVASSMATASTSYKDGTYTTTQQYSVPHGDQNSITVKLTIAQGKITAVTTNDNYSDGESSQYVSGFESSVSSDATGQSLSSYSPSRIGGASLTTAAFSNAIDTIRSQAAA